MTNLAEQLQILKSFRDEKEEWLHFIAMQQDVVNKVEEYQGLLRRKVKLDAVVSEIDVLEKSIREAALANYATTKDKNPVPGLTIKIFKKLVYDVKEAEEWARIKAPAVFKFNISAFEKVATELGAPVKEEEEPRAQIATTL
jgi:hypothetical protein